MYLLPVFQAIANNTSRSSDDLKLLGLPPEVRNRIFQYALIEEEEEEIELSANTPTLPALLTVCKQIRSETIFLYYTMNNFYLTIDDYDAAAALPSLKTYMKYFVEIEGREDHSKFDINLTAGQTGSGCCRRIHTSEISYLGVEPESVDQVLLALEAVQDTIVEMDGRPWAEVEKVLEGYHRCVVLMDPAWATGR